MDVSKETGKVRVCETQKTKEYVWYKETKYQVCEGEDKLPGWL